MTSKDLASLIKTASDRMRTDDNTKLVTKYIEHLSWLLFLKVHEALEDEQAILSPAYRRIIDSEHRWSVWTSRDWRADELITYVNEELLPYLRGLNTTPAGSMIASIFGGINTVMRSGYVLKEVIGIVDQIDFHEPDEVHTISVVYESLLGRLGNEAGWSGEFYTPRPIVRAMVRIVDPQIGDRVYDPASGSAGFLVEAHEHMRASERTLEDHETLKAKSFYGQESGELPFLLSTMNLILHGVAQPNLTRRNTLEEDVRAISLDRQYDVVLTNPPFGGKENPQIQQNFPARASATELLFLQHVMASLRPRGRAAVVLPDGVLFRNERAFMHVRRSLVEDFNLTAIVRLPPGVFPYATATRTNLVFFSNEPSVDEVRFISVSSSDEARGFSKTRPIAESDLTAAVAWLRDGEPTQGAWTVSTSDIRAGAYSLDLSPPEESFASDASSARQRLTKLARVASEVTDGLASLAEMPIDPSRYSFDELLPLGSMIEKRGSRAADTFPTRFIGVTNSGGIGPLKGKPGADTSRYQQVQVGDFLYNPMRVNVGSIGFAANEVETGYASPDYVVFRLRPDAPVTEEYVLHYLKSPAGLNQIARNAQGGVRSRLYFDNLSNIQIPIPSDLTAWDSLISGWSTISRLTHTANTDLGNALAALFRWNSDPGDQ